MSEALHDPPSGVQPKATDALMSVGMMVSKKASFGTGYLEMLCKKELQQTEADGSTKARLLIRAKSLKREGLRGFPQEPNVVDNYFISMRKR